MQLCDIKCAHCRVAYSWPGGCDTCKPAKASLITPEEGRTDLDLTVDAALRLLRMNLDRLEFGMRTTITQAYNQEHAKASTELARAMAALAAEARKLEERSAARVRNATAEERSELLVEAWEQLPPAYQREVARAVQMRLEAPNAFPAEIE